MTAIPSEPVLGPTLIGLRVGSCFRCLLKCAVTRHHHGTTLFPSVPVGLDACQSLHKSQFVAGWRVRVGVADDEDDGIRGFLPLEIGLTLDDELIGRTLDAIDDRFRESSSGQPYGPRTHSGRGSIRSPSIPGGGARPPVRKSRWSRWRPPAAARSHCCQLDKTMTLQALSVNTSRDHVAVPRRRPRGCASPRNLFGLHFGEGPAGGLLVDDRAAIRVEGDEGLAGEIVLKPSSRIVLAVGDVVHQPVCRPSVCRFAGGGTTDPRRREGEAVGDESPAAQPCSDAKDQANNGCRVQCPSRNSYTYTNRHPLGTLFTYGKNPSRAHCTSTISTHRRSPAKAGRFNGGTRVGLPSVACEPLMAALV